MKFKTKITISFVVIISLIVCFGGFILYQIENIKSPLVTDLPQSIVEIKKTSKLNSLSQFIRYYDEVSTQSARNYAFTGDKKWEERYQTIEPQLDKTIKQAISESDEKDKTFFSNIDAANTALVKLEYQSLKFTDDGKNKEAISILESKQYSDLENVYHTNLMDYVTTRVSTYDDVLVTSTQKLESTASTIQNLFTNTTQLVILVIVLSVPSALLIWWTILRGIVIQITRLNNATKEISFGKLDVSVDVVGGNDEIGNLSSSFNSMTESLKKSKDLLFESEFRYRNLYDSSPVLLRTIDDNGIILDCNDTYAHTLGFTKDEIFGKSIYEHIPTQQIEPMKESFEEWKKTGIIKDREIWLKKKDGTIFPVLLSANNLFDKSGKLIGSNTVLRNMADIYSAKEEILDLKMKRLTVIGELSARIAHDLRNPLSILKNSLELIKIRMPPDNGTSKDLAMAQRAVSRMSHQIEEVLDYVTPKPLNLQKCLLSDFLSFTVEKIDLPKDVIIHLPITQTIITCDQLKMEIVFINLINNAVQAMNNFGRIDIRTNYEDGFTIIEVEDSGSGIPDELLPKIFDPLFTTRQIGTGLGLPSVKSIIEKHGGTIIAKNGINKGALFIIKLPKT